MKEKNKELDKTLANNLALSRLENKLDVKTHQRGNE
jgi:hypothetical protein